MDKKSKIFFVVFFLLIAGAIGATYYRYFIVRDYIIEAQAACDPFTEACFVVVCDPKSEVDECTGNPEHDTSYYQEISRNARNIPLCDPADESCEALICPVDEADCTVTFCDADTVTEGVVCNDPAVYTSLHSEEDGAASLDTSIDASTDDTEGIGIESEDVAPETSEDVSSDAGE